MNIKMSWGVIICIALAVWYIVNWLDKRLIKSDAKIDALNGQVGNLARQVALLPPPLNS
jgi:hypothetical protein